MTNKKIMLIESGSSHGLVDMDHAENLATSQGMDLVRVGLKGETEVYKIQDSGKIDYEKKKKHKSQKTKSQKKKKIKTIKLRPSIGLGDIKIKAKQVMSFLNAGNKVNISMTFRGREFSHIEVGEDVLDAFLENVDYDYVLEKSSSQYQIIYRLLPKN